MNFEDSPQEAEYRARVRRWIEANAPDLGPLSAEERRNWHPRHKEIARQWQATKADAGYACISWPKERGGAGGSAIEEAIFNQEEARAGVQFTYFMTGLHMLLPALMEHSTDAASLAQVALSLAHRRYDDVATFDRNLERSPRPEPLAHRPADSKPAVWWTL